jgi:hypothetical protein
MKLTDRILLVIFSVLDLILAFTARHYLNSINDTATRMVARATPAAEDDTLRDLEQQAQNGQWEDFEKRRTERVTNYLQSSQAPSSSIALYFFPETLPDASLEKDFAIHELKPKIEALKKAYQHHDKKEIELAYNQLKSRVENYELGTSTDPEQMSTEAKKFLNLYQEFIDFNKKSRH